MVPPSAVRAAALGSSAAPPYPADVPLRGGTAGGPFREATLPTSLCPPRGGSSSSARAASTKDAYCLSLPTSHVLQSSRCASSTENVSPPKCERYVSFNLGSPDSVPPSAAMASQRASSSAEQLTKRRRSLSRRSTSTGENLQVS